jgi:pyruvate kinase
MRRTKIVATIGPATSEPASMTSLIRAGVDVVRLNASHGTLEQHAANARQARAIAADLGRAIGVLIDLPGPKLRSGDVVAGEVELISGQAFDLRSNDSIGDTSGVSTTLPELGSWLAPGDEVFLADGEIVLEVTAVHNQDVATTVRRGGTLRSRKGMHVPQAENHIDPFTARDGAALDLAVEIKADFVGLSFIRNADDIDSVRSRLPRRGMKPALIAKIETALAIDNLSAIISTADAVMVARGDLGIQIPARRVPLIQKDIIRLCNIAGRPVITATQMLESMTRSPLPTRAEVNDVANAVIDGTDALMLSEETAVGSHPSDVVTTMAEVAEAAETWDRHIETPDGATSADNDRVAWAVAAAAVHAAEDLSVSAILCPTRSGQTARRVAAFRPTMPIAGISPNHEVLGGLCLVWGVTPVPVPETSDGGQQLRLAVQAARTAGLVSEGDLVALVFGDSGPRAGSTDSVRIVRA